MAWWQRMFGGSSRGRVVALLRRGDRTVEELAAALGLTDNAVRAQLALLERENVVRATGVRRDGTVGKPATAWQTERYTAPRFGGGLKKGVGLVLQVDGKPALHRLQVTSPTSAWSAEVYVADTAKPRPFSSPTMR